MIIDRTAFFRLTRDIHARNNTDFNDQLLEKYGISHMLALSKSVGTGWSVTFVDERRSEEHTSELQSH
mgnify:CR=1 FL=1